MAINWTRPPKLGIIPGPRSDPKAATVESRTDTIRKADETSTDSWLQRAAAAPSPGTGTSDAVLSAAHAMAGRSQGGWDPMEVWLRHVDRPRRLRQLATAAAPRRGS